MNLIKLDNLQLSYGEQVIFDQLNLIAKRGDRICLVGRNGVGKSTLLKTISGEVDVDGGHVWRDPAITLATLSQDLPEESDITVFDFVAGGMAQLGRDLARYAALSCNADQKSLDELGKIQARIEAVDGWTAHNRIEQVLTRLGLDGTVYLGDMSGGWRRRVALARALVCQPDVLLLDEPTNHLDIVSIEWLEKQLIEFQGAVVFVTHDRSFLKNVANKIGEVDRGQMTLWDGDYTSFLTFREQQLADEDKRNSEFDKKLAQEEVWIRQGIKARRTRNEGRVRALKQLRNERSERRERLGSVKMEVTSDSASGKLVAELKSVNFSWDGTPIVSNFSSTIVRGDKIGLIGPNGIGKSTFLKLLLKEIEPQSGEVKLGSNLSIAYFDQLRDQLNLDQSAVDNIAEGREFIEINGKPKHVISYLNDFMFTGERARTPIRALSGGERNRILLAKLFSKPANCLIMDEPTNDLDAETLDLLEDLLLNYEGTLFLVSHDREFLDNVVTSTISFEGGGVLKEYVGGYGDWQRQGGVWYQGPDSLAANDVKSSTAQAESQVSTSQKTKPAPKISYKLQKELDDLPAKLERLEADLEKLQDEMCAPGFYDGLANIVKAKTELVAEKDKQLQAHYARWEELEALRAECS